MKEKPIEEKLEELRAISERLSDGSISLDESVKLFEKGVKLSGEIEKKLGAYELKINMLQGAEDDALNE